MKKQSKGSKKQSTTTAEPYLIILMGLPGERSLAKNARTTLAYQIAVGSGKSTLAKSLGVPVFARDELGSTDAVKRGMTKDLKNGKSVAVDCVNIHPKVQNARCSFGSALILNCCFYSMGKDRILWATVARQIRPNCKLVLMHVDVDPEECITRVQERKHHATLGPDQAREAVEMFAKGFKPPQSYELGKMKYELMLNTRIDADFAEKLRAILS